MDIEDLKQKVLESRREGFSDKEIRMAMRQDGVTTRQINRAFRQISSRNQDRTGQTDKRQYSDHRSSGKNYSNNISSSRNPQKPGKNRNSNPQRQGQRKGKRSGQRKQSENKGSKERQGRNQTVDVLKRINLSDDSYTIKQKLISLADQYTVYDQGEPVIKAKRKLLKLKEDIVFRDFDGNEIFEITADQIQDIAGDYTVTDSETGEPVIVLEKDFTLATHKWEVKEPQEKQVIAHIESKSAAVSWLRALGAYTPVLPNFLALIPHGYRIQTPGGQDMGEISGRLHIKDIYDIDIHETGNVPREAIVAAAVAVDTLEGN